MECLYYAVILLVRYYTGSLGIDRSDKLQGMQTLHVLMA